MTTYCCWTPATPSWVVGKDDYESKARLMVGAMNRMGYDAVTVGEGELRLRSEGLLWA